MMRAALLLALTIAMPVTPALACTPPLPGGDPPAAPSPGDAVIAEGMFRQSAEIVYGRVIRATPTSAQFRVLHVYKGSLRPGAIFTVRFGMPEPSCGGPSRMPPAKGAAGVIGYSGQPKLDFIEQKWIDRMIAAGWIKRARR